LRASAEALYETGYADIMDPEARLPQTCSFCRSKASHRNPLVMRPVDTSMKVLAKSYMYRAVCHDCRCKRRG
jgi:hypothetical protein